MHACMHASTSSRTSTMALQHTGTSEQVLRRYCSPYVVQEYESLGSSEKGALLTALLTAQRDNLIQLHQQQYNEQTKAITNSKDCPLVRAFLEMGVQANMLSEDAIQYCRLNMSTWGYRPDLFQHADAQIQRYQDTVDYQKKNHPDYYGNSSGNIAIHQTSKSIVKTGGKMRQWNTLRKIGIADLRLFGTCKGCYLEGTIVGEAIQPMVGGTTLIRDASGKILIVCFYNVLPDGIYGAQAEPMLSRKFPLGSTIRIAEPFLKIFRDGSRGIRVDNPAEIQVIGKVASSGTALKQEELDKELVEAKERGNAFVKEKRYDAAMDTYVSALRTDEFIATVLSNRAQAYISLNDWALGLCDAAASLTIRPKSKKTWERYKLCQSKLNESESTTKEVLLTLSDRILPPRIHVEDDSSDGQEYKAKGNEAFTKKDYDSAIRHYSCALVASGLTVRALLSNWALCALEIGAMMDVIAAASAAIRISVDEKVVYRLTTALAFLGEYNLAIHIARLVANSSSVGKLRKEIEMTQSMIENNIFRDCRNPDLDRLHSVGTWIGPVETFMTKSKGRGIRATRDISSHEVIMVQRPIAFADFNLETENTVVTSVSETRVDKAATVKLKAALTHRSQEDSALSWIVNCLSDGSKSNPLVELSKLTLNLDSCPLLLPGRYDYMEGKTPLLTADRIENIISMNIHGFGSGNKDRSELFPALSMLNHSRNSNCDFVNTRNKSVAIVAAIRPIKKHEELCIRYLDNEDEVTRHWGDTME